MKFCIMDRNPCNRFAQVAVMKKHPKIAEGPPAAEGCPAALRDLLFRCLSYDPQDRPSSQEVLEVIQQIQRDF